MLGAQQAQTDASLVFTAEPRGHAHQRTHVGTTALPDARGHGWGSAFKEGTCPLQTQEPAGDERLTRAPHAEMLPAPAG